MDQVDVTVDAPPERVWRAVVDVGSWPAWTRSVQRVEPLDGGELRVGSRTRIKQPGMPPIVWKVTSVDPGRQFTWVSRSPGVRTTARHVLEPAGDGTRLTLTVEHSGPLAAVAGALTRKRTLRYMQLEANGMKAAGEEV